VAALAWLLFTVHWIAHHERERPMPRKLDRAQQWSDVERSAADSQGDVRTTTTSQLHPVGGR